MNVLAIDPGSRATGIAIVNGVSQKFEITDCWMLAPNKSKPLKVRLRSINAALNDVMSVAVKRGVEAMVIEEPPSQWRDDGTGKRFNQRAPLVLGMVCGLAISCWERHRHPRPYALVPVGDWRKIIGFPRLSSPKNYAVTLCKALTGTAVQHDVAEAILLGWAALQRPSIVGVNTMASNVVQALGKVHRTR